MIGEGGSGGALALAAPGNVWAVPSSYCSVIAPEGAAAILPSVFVYLVTVHERPMLIARGCWIAPALGLSDNNEVRHERAAPRAGPSGHPSHG